MCVWSLGLLTAPVMLNATRALIYIFEKVIVYKANCLQGDGQSLTTIYSVDFTVIELPEDTSVII